MASSHPKTREIEKWLAAAPEFSRPIAEQLREWFLRWEPDLSEAVKWHMLCFSGRKLVCGIGPFKKHLSIVFFRGAALADPAGLIEAGGTNANIRGVRIESPDAINRDALRALLRAAVVLDATPEIRPAPKQKRAPLPVPDFLAKALKRNRAAAAGFAKLSPSCQREYIEWLSTGKREETRERRLAEALAALASGRKWADRNAAPKR